MNISLKRNTLANYIGQGYQTLAGIVILPFFLRYLGAEAYGLVGFFLVLQGWMQLLDMGMSPMLSRQAAQVSGMNIDFLELKRLLRSLELIVLAIAVIVFFSIYWGSVWISTTWLNVGSLPVSRVTICIVLMGAMLGLRFFATLYRSGIVGLENQVQLNIVNIALVSLKNVGGLLLLRFITQDYVDFFIFQFVVGIVEVVALAATFYHGIPQTNKVGITFFWNTLKPMLPFASGIAYTSGVWVLLTQLDKIILSNVMALAQYGYFSVVVVIATGITQVSSPISQAILPRMTALLSQNREQDMIALYRKSTQLMAVFIMPLAGIIAVFPKELVLAWTGDRNAAEWGGPILSWLALGNGILAFGAFQYYLQFAHGKLKMHVIYSTITACIQVPVVLYVAFKYGAYGVALLWFAIRLVTFAIWTPIVHSMLAPGLHWSWLLEDILPVFFSTSIFLVLVSRVPIDFVHMGRVQVFGFLMCISAISLVINVLASNESRAHLTSVLQKVGH